MNYGDELVKIRRFLRDPVGSIWSDAYIKHIYNDIQQDFQHKTSLLMDVAVQRVPGVYEFSYQHDWEFVYIDETQVYQCLLQHDGNAITSRWEVQQIAGIDGDVGDYGAHFTQPWEAYMTTAGDVIKMRFARNFNSMRFIAYNEQTLFSLSQKEVQNDPAYVNHTGLPYGYYPYDQVDNSYVLYPRPSAGFSDELDSVNGGVFFATDDTEDATTGVIATRSGSFDPDDGLPVDMIDTANNVFMVYEASPVDMSVNADESEFPDFMLKYIRFGVIARAYGGNNDGKIKTLSDYWGGKYLLGISVVKKYMQKKRQDRDYRLTTKGVKPFKNVRHARLPAAYPVSNP